MSQLSIPRSCLPRNANTPKQAVGTATELGRTTSPATRWSRRWTSSASMVDLHFLLSRCPATTRATPVENTEKAHPDRFAIVKTVDPDDPKVADIIAD